MKNAACGLLLMASPGLALASTLSYDFIEFGYVQAKPDEGDLKTNALGIEYSNALSPSMFFSGSVARSETDDVHIPDVNPALGDFNGTLVGTTLAAGLGGHYGLSDATDLVYTGSLIFAKISGDGENGGDVDDDDVGFGATFGLRSALSDTFEGKVGLGYASLFSEGDVSYGAGLLAHVGERAGLSLDVEFGDDVKAYGLGIRYRF